jgi:hypothetical protein
MGTEEELAVSVRKRSSVTRLNVPVLTVLFCWLIISYAAEPLHERIPKPDPTKYKNIQDAKDWENPYLVVYGDGTEIVGRTSTGKNIPLDSVAEELAKLPTAAWPYGLVVAVQETGIRAVGQDAKIEANRKALIARLNALNITVDVWPSA